MSSTDTTQWNISTDIYSIVDSVNKLKARFVEDENETTLALGIFGFLGDIEAKKIQSSIIMTGELGNEMFPARSKLNKNILAHAIYANIEGINASPATLTILIGIKESDLNTYMNDNEFVFEASNGIFVRDKEFRLDYDIILKRYIPMNSTEYVYTAMYDLSNPNSISNIVNAHITQPSANYFNNEKYIFFPVTVHQITMPDDITDNIISDSIISNKSYTFSFANQLADFEVYVEDKGVETRLTPLFYGSPVDQDVDKYCWYLYINDNTVRIGFDSASYTPGLNSKIRIVVRTTLGKNGNFTYNNSEQNDVYCDFVSPYSRNKKITCLISCLTASENGKDRKTIDELKNLIPKMAMSRGYVTTETDLNNYFNLISDDDNMLKPQKKVDNQLERVWYIYYLLKDDMGNIVPTNTMRIKVNTDDMTVTDGSRFILPAGTGFVYDPNKGYAVIGDCPEPFSDEYFDVDTGLYYYKSIYDIVLNTSPLLYASKYLSIVNYDSFFTYIYVNSGAPFGFTTSYNHFEKKLLSDKDKYVFSFQIVQNINQDYGMITIDEETGAVVDCKIKCFIVIYQNGLPYRYKECELVEYSEDLYATNWEATFTHGLDFDEENRIQLLDLFEIGMNSPVPGYFDSNCEAYLYIAADLGTVYPDENNLIGNTVPGIEEYSLLDVYKVENGINFFYNFTKLMNTKVVKNTSTNNNQVMYDIYGVPMVGQHYFQDESKVAYLIKCMIDKKNYVDYCLSIIENNMDIDFKFFNTYGYSLTYTIGDKEGTSVGNVAMNFRFRVKISASADAQTKDSLVQYIKSYIEDIAKTEDVHIPNLIHDIKETYGDSIIYIEFMNYNDLRLGLNHIELRDIVDPHTVPEFINVRNNLAEDGYTLQPQIDIEVVN